VLEVAGGGARPARVMLAATGGGDCAAGERAARERYLRMLDDITNGRPERWIPPEEVWPSPD
jgi:hypothetical protein